MDFPKLLT